MAHDIIFNLASVELTKSDSSIIIKRDKKALGTITISKGSIDYYPRSRSVNAISLTWSQFDDLMKRWEKGDI